jgi:dienelactone hydrolase
MNSVHHSQRLAAAAALFMASLTVAAAPAPLEAFFDDPVLSGAALSPDGRLVAMRVASKNAKARLVVLDLQTFKPTPVAGFDDAPIGRFQWVNSQRLVFDTIPQLLGPNIVEFGPGLFAVNADGSRFRQLVKTSVPFAVIGSVNDTLLPWPTQLLQPGTRREGDHVFVVLPGEASRERLGYFKLQWLNTVSGRAEELEMPLHAQQWILDADDKLRAVTTRQQDQLALQFREADKPWAELRSFSLFSPRAVTPRYIAPDGQLYVEAQHQGRSALFLMDRSTGTLSDKPVLASQDFDVHASFINGQGKLLGLRYTIDAEVTQWLDADMKALQGAVDVLLPNSANRLDVPLRGDSPFVLVTALADMQPDEAYIFNKATRKLTRLGTSHPAIDRAQMGQTDFVRYKARDGLVIPAYLTLPSGRPRKNLPLVVLVHGGPWVRGADWRWNAEVQFLASRGYAVLQPEFRGSTGHGSALFEAGHKQWGRAMQTDLVDGVRWAVAQGFADAQRVAVAGASYGGYATLMGLADAPETFRCGISWVGVTDVNLLFSRAWSDMNNETKTYSMGRLIGDPVLDAEMLKAVSPVHNAARIKQPLLLAYGEWDARVPLEHGRRLRDALKPHNSDVEWVVYDKEGHGWSQPKTRIDFWGRAETFLRRCLAPR